MAATRGGRHAQVRAGREGTQHHRHTDKHPQQQERRQRHAASPLTLQRTSGKPRTRPGRPGSGERLRGAGPGPPGVDYLLRCDVREVGRGRAERGVPWVGLDDVDGVPVANPSRPDLHHQSHGLLDLVEASRSNLASGPFPRVVRFRGVGGWVGGHYGTGARQGSRAGEPGQKLS
jgi:hypothetical protein